MALTKVSGDFIKDGVLTVGHLHTSHGITTAHIGEGSNLYFTNARVDSRIGDLSTSNLSEGTNLYYTDARVGSYLTTNNYATQSYVNTQVSNLVDSAPSTLDTLNELAAALGDDANFSTTVTNSIATKLPLAGGTITSGTNIGLTINHDTFEQGLVLHRNHATNAASIVFKNNSGMIGTFLGISSDNQPYWQEGSGTDSHKIWTANNDGSGSGLDADLLDGINSTGFVKQLADLTSGAPNYQTPSSRRVDPNSGNPTNEHYAISTFGNGGNVTGQLAVHLSNGSGYIRSHNNSWSNWRKLWHDNNDGSGSGLDADLLDGLHASSFLQTTGGFGDFTGINTALNSRTGTGAAIGTYSSAYAYIDLASTNSSFGSWIDFTKGDGADYAGRIRYHNSNETFTFTTGGSNNEFIIYTTYTYSPGSSRAPIFYDSDNTGYYTNPASTSILNRVEIDDDLDVRAQTGTWITSNIMGDAIGWNTDYGVYIGSNVGGTHYLRGNGTFTTGGSTYNLWHQGNDGSGSGLDADLLDGNHASTFLTNTNDRFYLTDTRSASRAPSYYDDRYIQGDFSQSANFGVSGGDAWAGILTVSKWANWDASHRQEQLIFAGTKLARRVATSDSAWSSTYDIIDTSSVNNVKAGYIQSSASLRAPIFYDSNNTGYYVDAASTSKFNILEINNGSSGNQKIEFKDSQTSGYSALRFFYNNAEQNTIHLFGSTWSSNFEGGSRGAINLSGYTGTTFGAWNSPGAWVYNNGQAQFQQSVRSPIFYDSNDTGYYIDPAGNSNVNTINGFGFSQTGGNGKILVTNSGNGYLYLNNWIQVDSAGIFSGHNNAHFYPNLSSDYGAWKIAGTRGGWSGITFDVSGSNVTLMASTGTMGMYNDTDNEWMLECQRNSYTRLYYNGVEQGRTDNGFFLLNNQARSPIYYDSNNTTYYIDPDSTSLSGKLRSYLIFNDYGAGVVGTYTSTRYQLVFAMGNSYKGALDGTSVSGGYGLWYSHPNAGGVAANLSDHGLMNIVNGSWHASLASSTRASSDMRAPIFYDLNNTTYYTRPSTYSYMNQIWTAGTIQAGSSGTGNIYLGNNGISGSGNHFRFHTHGGATYFDMNSGTINWRQGSSTRYYFYPSTANMTVNGTITQYSDIRYKENIVEIPDAIDKIKSIRGVYYNRTDFNTEPTKIGVIAQEVEVLMPELILQAEDTNLKSVSYNELTAVLVQAIKEQQTIIDDLKSRIETLENQ